MMLRTEITPFPRQDEVATNEDGVGFALRMATANGLSFRELAHHLASPGHLYLPAHASDTIAFMFGCTPSRLKNAFVVRQRHHGTQTAEFLGHRFLRPYHLRQGSPQVCPACLAEDRIARAIWSVCLVTSCPLHGNRLLDRCQCGRPTHWRRPALDICECGRGLTAAHQQVSRADPREHAVSCHVASLLEPTSNHFSSPRAKLLPCGLEGLSVDAFLRLFWIFGIVGPGQITGHPNCANRCLPTSEAADVVCRAFDRLVPIIANRPSKEPLRAPLPALQALYDECIATADVRFIGSLISRLQKRFPSPQLHRLACIDPQLSLFGVADEHL